MIDQREEKLLLNIPVARIEIFGNSLGVSRISFKEKSCSNRTSRLDNDSGSFSRWKQLVYRWFNGYFSGEIVAFSPLLQPEGTDFQKEVWRMLRTIAPGETRTYGEVATIIGREGAARAVGQACGRNPIPILIPCHRVVPATGGIGGYSGPAEVKTALLKREDRKGKRNSNW